MKSIAWTVGVVVMAAGSMTLTGCPEGPAMGEVSGMVTIDGEVPPDGSSINFIPVDGSGPTAGASLEQGKYTALVPVGTARVEIRAPQLLGSRYAPTQGPGSQDPNAGGEIKEMLPAKYNVRSELTLDVKQGENPKDWPLKTKS